MADICKVYISVNEKQNIQNLFTLDGRMNHLFQLTWNSFTLFHLTFLKPWLLKDFN